MVTLVLRASGLRRIALPLRSATLGQAAVKNLTIEST